jgi:hypothetical protein
VEGLSCEEDRVTGNPVLCYTEDCAERMKDDRDQVALLKLDPCIRHPCVLRDTLSLAQRMRIVCSSISLQVVMADI